LLGRVVTPGTTYHSRLDAQSSAGAARGADRTFTTAKKRTKKHKHPCGHDQDKSSSGKCIKHDNDADDREVSR
jgi:hypothetical protein